jgi:hypothetical protein
LSGDTQVIAGAKRAGAYEIHIFLLDDEKIQHSLEWCPELKNAISSNSEEPSDTVWVPLFSQ